MTSTQGKVIQCHQYRSFQGLLSPEPSQRSNTLNYVTSDFSERWSLSQFKRLLAWSSPEVRMKTMHQMSRQTEFRAGKTCGWHLLYFKRTRDAKGVSFQKRPLFLRSIVCTFLRKNCGLNYACLVLLTAVRQINKSSGTEKEINQLLKNKQTNNLLRQSV